MAITWLEINKKNLLHNIRQFRQIAPKSELWPVVKSNAYGHGVSEVVDILKDNSDVSGFMVASLEEAMVIKNMTKKPIMVLSYFDRDDIELLKKVYSQISLPVYDFDTIDYLDDLKLDLNVNLKIDTGTSRLGFSYDVAEEAKKHLLGKKNLNLNSIFTHYAESEAEDQTFTKEQLSKFKQISKGYKAHSACSAASIALPEAQADIIRLGLSLYGMWPSEVTKRRGWMLQVCLQPVLTWKTKIIQIKDIKKGDSVGYNRTYKLKEDAKLAIIPVGYNEGYSRALSNKSEVIIKGQKYPIRGNICMNMSMLELPVDSDIEVGDIVTLLGEDGGYRVSADDLARHAETINYEVTTKINSSLLRKIV